MAIAQIDSFISQAEAFVKILEDSLIGLRIINKIPSNDFIAASKIIPNIKEMFDKHRELIWYGKQVDAGDVNTSDLCTESTKPPIASNKT